jgi:hypothetical protein
MVRSGHGWQVGWRWIAVLAGVAVLCCLPALASALPVSVPNLTPQQLEQRILASQRLSFAGYAESNADFGLPPLPAFSSVTPLLDGVTRLRVWQASADRWRVDTLSDVGENDTYQLGDSTYVWDSGQQLLTGIFGAETVRLPRAADLVPSSLAVRLISWAGAGAKLSSLPPRRVAGQTAAGLAVSPASSQSTIARVDIWAAPGTGIPLLVQIFGRASAAPALQSQFLQVGLWTPGGSVLTPQAGPGAGFTTTTPASFAGALKNLATVRLPWYLAGFAQQRSPLPQIHVYGSGLTAFAVLAFPPGTGNELLSTALDDGATQLTFADSDGDGTVAGTAAIASAPLVNLVLVKPAHSPDTFLLVGFVTKAAMEQAADALTQRPHFHFPGNH